MEAANNGQYSQRILAQHLPEVTLQVSWDCVPQGSKGKKLTNADLAKPD
jgi:hypothetical protein